MIFAHDKGRLCNNLLQYGHVYAWGREHGRQTMSMRFAYKYRYFNICHTRRHNILSYLFAKYGAKWGLLPVAEFDEAGKDYSTEEQMMLSHSNIVVEGWYARWYDLFLKYREEIVRLFAFDDGVKVRPDRLMASVPAATLKLGLHVRRGDYKTWHEGRYYYTDGQYIGFVRQFLAMHTGRDVHVFVCGNDPAIDRDGWRNALAGTAVDFPCGSPGEDLYLLSRCDFLIGPPSTFSLVAAMYRDVPLCWVSDASKPLTSGSFSHFDQLFRNIE